MVALLNGVKKGEDGRIMFKKYLKRRKIKYLGELTDALFTTLPFFSVYGSLSITVILYAQIREWLQVWIPWMTLWIFMFIIGFLLSIAIFLTYKYVIPSLWHSRSTQMSHLEEKMNTLEKKLDMILENTNSKEKRIDSDNQ